MKDGLLPKIKMKQLQAELTPEGSEPLTLDEVVDRVLGIKSGYIIGLGHGPKATKSKTSRRDAELEEALREAHRANRELKEQLQARDERLERLEARQFRFDKLYDALKASGSLPPTFTMWSKQGTVLVHATAGGVGSLLCQWEKALGATVIGAVSTEEKAKQAKEDGCHHVIFYKQEDFVSRVNEITSGHGVEVVYDSAGKDTFQANGHSIFIDI